MLTPYHFFLKHAGCGYDPATETRARGRIRCAQSMARAEKLASAQGWSFEWSVDPDIDSTEWRDDCEAYPTWQCLARDDTGTVRASLHGIDFGPDGEPWGDPYRRVVEAELAMEGAE